MANYTPIKFDVIDKPDWFDQPDRPGNGRGRSPLTDAILATLDSGKVTRIALEGRKPDRTANRLRANLRRYNVVLRVRKPTDYADDSIYVLAVSKREPPITDIPFQTVEATDIPPDSFDV